MPARSARPVAARVHHAGWERRFSPSDPGSPPRRPTTLRRDVHGRDRRSRPVGARNISGSPGDKQFLLEEMGCGAAFFDYDHDGWLDIFLVNGSSFDPKVRDRKPTQSSVCPGTRHGQQPRVVAPEPHTPRIRAKFRFPDFWSPYSAWLARLRLIVLLKLQGQSGRPGLGSSRPGDCEPQQARAFCVIFNWTRQKGVSCPGLKCWVIRGLKVAP